MTILFKKEVNVVWPLSSWSRKASPRSLSRLSLSRGGVLIGGHQQCVRGPLNGLAGLKQRQNTPKNQILFKINKLEVQAPG